MGFLSPRIETQALKNVGSLPPNAQQAREGKSPANIKMSFKNSRKRPFKGPIKVGGGMKSCVAGEDGSVHSHFFSKEMALGRLSLGISKNVGTLDKGKKSGHRREKKLQCFHRMDRGKCT